MSSNQVILEGEISILAALQGQSREIEVIYLQKNKRSGPLAWLERKARAHNIPVHSVTEEYISRLASGHTHGGALALTGPRRVLPLDALGRGQACPLIFMLDGIEDPFNFGQAVRALYAAGVHGLVVRNRDWGSAGGVVARASAGASELIALAEVDTPAAAADHFHARGLAVACTGAEADACPIFHANLAGPLFVFIGGERRGITRSMLRASDLLLQVPYAGGFSNALSAASAAAVIAFEALRQRLYNNGFVREPANGKGGQCP
jgi:23S rRNA (guanosine2251-2'-O)-methyltransferase